MDEIYPWEVVQVSGLARHNEACGNDRALSLVVGLVRAGVVDEPGLLPSEGIVLQFETAAVKRPDAVTDGTDYPAGKRRHRNPGQVLLVVGIDRACGVSTHGSLRHKAHLRPQN